MNQHGHLKDMEVNVSDFALMPLTDEHTTVGDMVDKAKLNKLKFYLKTRLRSPLSTRECNTNDTESSDGDISPMLRQRVHSTLGSPPLAQHARSTLSTPPSAQCASSKEYITLMPPHYASSTESLFTGAPSTDDDDVCLLDNDMSTADNVIIPIATSTPAWQESLQEIEFASIHPMVQEPRHYKITLHRGQVFRELVEWFKQDRDGIDFTTYTITFDVILPNGDREQGQDAGVVRDVLSEFWEDFYEQCTTGHKAKVPCFRHDFDKEDWTSVAHVIAMGWILQNILPLRLAPSFLESCLFGLHKENMRDEFFNFISPSERNMLTEALEDFNQVDMEELIDVLSDHGCNVRVTREHIETVIDQIATTEMIQTPAFVKECFFGVLMGYGFDSDLQLQFQRTTPTSRRIISIMDCDDPEAASYNHLRKYVREIEGDEKMLRNFLRFVTGSDLLLSGNGPCVNQSGICV